MLMKQMLALRAWMMLLVCMLMASVGAMAQKTVTGKVTDVKGGTWIPGASITLKGGLVGTSTDNEGNFTLNIPADGKTLVISAVGYGTREVTIDGTDFSQAITLATAQNDLNEVVVIGYGTARKKDITGSVASVKEKDFNKGVLPAPDQLIQGKVAGVQVVNNSGAPGAGTTFRIRGASSLRAGNGPLFVVDGVQLSNTEARPGIDLTGLGSTPGGNPLNFINTADISSMEVLKDASAAAIYGSRGANGVVLITTKRGLSGLPKVDVSASVGVANMLRSIDVLSGDQYRTALGEFGFPTGVNSPQTPSANFGGNENAMDAITRTGIVQNYNVGFSSGNENARYRLSLGYMDQEGILKKSDFKKFTAGINSSFKLLPNRKLGLDVNLLTSQTRENIAPISNNAGFLGSIIGQALQWNPTRSLKRADGTFDVEQGGSIINPLAYSDAYNDQTNITTILGTIAPSYKITKGLEAKSQVSVTYSVGKREQFTTGAINIENVQWDANGKGGEANVANNELSTFQITNTLSYNSDLGSKWSLNAVLGHEYLKNDFGGNSMYARGFPRIEGKPLHYFMAASDPSTRRTRGFQDPTSELQSFFGRAILNFDNRFVFTGTIRSDGSSKFGENNRYGTFPSLAGAWNIDKEGFMEGNNFISSLRLRASWGVTGNQDFPSGASQILYVLDGGNPANFAQSQIANPDLKWESTTTTNIGLDFGFFSNRLTGNIDWFNRSTSDILFPREAADPVPPTSSIRWSNIDGTIVNTGFEFTLNYKIIQGNKLNWDFGVNATFLNNELKDFVGEIPTGEVNGQGLSGAFAQLIKTGQPINSFYLKKFIGIDKQTGVSLYEGGESKFFVGSPNPEMLLGFTTMVSYGKLSFELAGNGAFGQYIYNNTTNAVLAFNNLGKRNIGLSEYEVAKSLGEKPVNPTSASTRYLEKGDFFRLANATLSYSLGNVGKAIRGATVFVNCQNLALFTNFTGFDPEVNVSKPLNGVPSFGMEYTPYPPARTINFGINFSL